MEIKKLIKLEKHCEEDFKCFYCKSSSLVGCNPEEIILMCDNCKRYFGYDEKEDKIFELEDTDEKKDE